MNKIKLIALDLDGTALTPQNKVAETTTDAVRRAREAGVYVAVSTGRICGEARDFAVDLDADDLMVTSGGATLSSISGESCTMRMSMPWEAAVRAAAAVERIGMIAMIYVGETLLITPYDDLGFGSYKTNEGYLTSKKVVPSVAEYIADHHLSVDKIFVRSQDPVTLLRTRAILEQIPGIRVMSSAADNLEVITPAADKGTALGMLCRDIGTDLDHAAAIGDSENDFEMLRAVALPIAMGNASSEVKALCRWETDTNAEDGVAHAIDRILAHNKACDEQAEKQWNLTRICDIINLSQIALK